MSRVFIEQERKVDFQDVLFDLLLKMNYARAVNDENAYYNLIEHFEKLMIPYIDEKYEKEIEEINKRFGNSKEGKTPIEVATKKALMHKQKLEAKLGALLKLARRVGLLPAKGVKGKESNI